MTRPNDHEREDDHALAGEYVLGTLSLEQRKVLEARLPNEPELQKAVMAWEERFLPYTAITTPVAPSDYLWPRIERSLKAQKTPANRTGSAVVPPRPRRILHSLPFWRGAAGLGLAAAVVMGDEWQAPVSLGLVEPGQPIRMRLDQLPPLEDNQLFELTLEDKTGSATGLPTGPIEFIGRAVEI